VTLLVVELVNADLLALGVLDDLAAHAGLAERIRIRGQVRPVHDERDRKIDRSTGLRLDLLDLDEVTNGDLVLLAARFDDRVHGGLPLSSRNTFIPDADCSPDC